MIPGTEQLLHSPKVVAQEQLYVPVGLSLSAHVESEGKAGDLNDDLTVVVQEQPHGEHGDLICEEEMFTDFLQLLHSPEVVVQEKLHVPVGLSQNGLFLSPITLKAA